MDDKCVVVSFRYETAYFQLVYPTALSTQLYRLKKLFVYMTSDWNWRKENAEAVLATHTALRTYVEETKAAWKEASDAWVNGYVDTKYDIPYFHSPQQKKRVEAENKKLLNAVKRKQAANTRAERLLTYFESLMTQYEWWYLIENPEDIPMF